MNVFKKLQAAMFPPTHLHFCGFLISEEDGAPEDSIFHLVNESLISPALQLGTHCPVWDLAPLVWQSDLALSFRQLVHALMEE